MIDAREIGLVSRKKTIVPVNLSVRVTGLFYAVYGGAAALKLLQIAASGHGSIANICATAILTGFFLFGLVLTLSVETLTFDPRSREYEYRKGIWPFLKSSRGNIGDIKAISIDRIVRAQAEDDAAGEVVAAMLEVKIDWVDGRKPIFLFGASDEALFGSNRNRLLKKASRVAQAFKVPLIDCSK